jgi:hypothetical protein
MFSHSNLLHPSQTNPFAIKSYTNYPNPSLQPQPLQHIQPNAPIKKPKTSRWKIQSRKKRLSSKISKQLESKHQAQITQKCTHLSKLYGFTTNPDNSPSKIFSHKYYLHTHNYLHETPYRQHWLFTFSIATKKFISSQSLHQYSTTTRY